MELTIDMTDLEVTKQLRIAIEQLTGTQTSLEILLNLWPDEEPEGYSKSDLSYDIELIEGTADRLHRVINLREQYMRRQMGA